MALRACQSSSFCSRLTHCDAPGTAVCTLTSAQRAAGSKCALTSIEKPALNSGSTLSSAQNSEATPVHWLQSDLCLTTTQTTTGSVPPVRLSFGAAQLSYPWETARVILFDDLMYTENFTQVNSRDALKLIRWSALMASEHLEHLTREARTTRA